MEDWWSELDTAVLKCLREAGPIAPTEMAARLGMPEEAVTSLLCMLARERRIRISLVEPRETMPAGVRYPVSNGRRTLP